jgi:hypothetical protein
MVVAGRGDESRRSKIRTDPLPERTQSAITKGILRVNDELRPHRLVLEIQKEFSLSRLCIHALFSVSAANRQRDTCRKPQITA